MVLNRWQHWPHEINPIDHSDDGVTPPPETPPAESPPPKPRKTRRTAPSVSTTTMIEQGPKTYRAALDAEETEQWKEVIDKEVASRRSHEVLTFVMKLPEGANMNPSRWVVGRKLMAYWSIDKWTVRLVGRSDLTKLGDDNNITSPVIDSDSIRLAFLGCTLHDTLHVRHPDGELPDPYVRARPLVKWNKTLNGIKQANQEYYEEVFDFVVDDLSIQASLQLPISSSVALSVNQMAFQSWFTSTIS